jgi:lipopolysaccharide/colanic/teichoic acid biosynthesis glycosyltransferase
MWSHRRHDRPDAYRGKRMFDVTLLLIGSPVWLPLLVAVAIMVRVRLGRGVIFRQLRIGRDDRTFELLKFRTMSTECGPDGLPLPDDRRLTSFGRRLRSTSLDELPELLNVMRGDMSLVGPRPLLVRYLPLYSERHRLRHAVRPGLTGLAQISGRNTLSWRARLDLDVEYVGRQSLWLDLRILLRTAGIVLRREGIAAAGQATMAEFTGCGETDSESRAAHR